MAALSRIATGTHRHIHINPGDTVVFSSSPIPGNTVSVSRTINALYKAGAEVVHGRDSKVHASGHAGQEEQKLMLRLLKPKYFLPIHGEYRMQKVHAQTAIDCDVPEENCFVLENGEVLGLSRDAASIIGQVQASNVYVDGSGIGDIGNAVLRDRRILSEDGLVVVVTTINKTQNRVVSGPEILSRGFVYMKESIDLISDARTKIKDDLTLLLEEKKYKNYDVKNQIVETITPILYEKTQRQPMVVPIVMEVE